MIFIEFAVSETAHEKQHSTGVELARSMLEKYADEKNGAAVIHREKQGKPYFEAFENVDFSVSHSGETVLCAMYLSVGKDAKGALPFPDDGKLSFENSYYIEASADSPKVGADIECIESDMTEERLLALAERYFHEEENNYIRKNGFSREKFYSVWTKKESFGKMLGTGLKGILSGFDVTSETAAVIKSFVIENNGLRYIGAVCFKP